MPVNEVQQWLKDYPPLNPIEEQILFRRYNLGMRVLLNALAKELKEAYGRSVRLPKQDEPVAFYLRYLSNKLKIPYEQLWERMWACKDKLPAEDRALVSEAECIREKLFNHNLRLVVSIIGKFPKFAGMQFEDLFHEGVIGLGKAIDHYNVNEGTKFSTTAVLWIHQEIGRKLLQYSGQHGGMKIPVRLLERWSKLRKYLAKKGINIDDLSEDELIEVLSSVGLSQDAFLAINYPSVISIDQPVEDEPTADDREKTLSDVIEGNDTDGAEALLEANFRRRLIFRILDDLTERERLAILIYFGFDEDSEPNNLTEVGRRLGITRQRAQQLVKNALKKIREHPLLGQLSD